MLKHGILGLLNYSDMSGYEVMEVFRDSLNFFWTANTSQIYRELQTLKHKGFVVDRVVEQSGKPDKKIFSITDSGRDEFKNWLREFSYGNSNSPLLMKVFFSGEISKEENLERFHKIKAECAESLEKYSGVKEIMEAYMGMVPDPKTAVYWNMTLDYGIRYQQMLNEWCDSCIAGLEADENENSGY